MVPGSPTQVLFQPSAYPGLSQPSATALAQFQAPVQDLCLAYRDSLQAHRSGTLLSGGTSLCAITHGRISVMRMRT